MSEPNRLRAYRACVNLPEAANGAVVMIDDSDERWADRISSGMLAPVGPPVGYEPPVVPWTRDSYLAADGLPAEPEFDVDTDDPSF